MGRNRPVADDCRTAGCRCRALDAGSYFASVSNYMQHILAEVLEDGPWLEAYLRDNRAALGKSYDTIAGLLPHALLSLSVQPRHCLLRFALRS